MMNPDPVIPPGILSAHGIDPYSSSRRNRILFLSVLAVHLALVGIPLLFFGFFTEEEKEVIVIKAALVPPLGDSMDIPEDSVPGTPEPPAEQPLPAKPEPPAPEPVPEPDPLPPPQPKPQPKAVKTPPPVKTKPKTQPKPKTKPKPKTEKKNYLTVEDILKNRNKNKRVTETKNDPAAEAKRRAAEAQAKARQAALDKLAASVGNNTKRYGSTFGDINGSPDAKEFNSYYLKIKAILERNWTPPSKLELNGEKKVTVYLEIDSKGNIRTKRFEKTGSGPLNRSAEKLLQNLKTVPVPPQAMNFHVDLIPE